MLLLCVSFAECFISYLMQVFLLFIEKYFDMKKNQCKEGLDIYKKFLTRMTRISEFLKVAEVNLSQPNFALYLKQLIKCLFSHKADTFSLQLNCRIILSVSTPIRSFEDCIEKPDYRILIGLSFT